MVTNTGHTLNYYLISRLILSLIFIMPLLSQDSTEVIVEKESTFYPGKPLIMSLIVPGLGQLYNKEPLWKPGVFIATEIVSLTSILYANKRAEEIRLDYQKFADENWNVIDWWNFTSGSGPYKQIDRDYNITSGEVQAMMDYVGTHNLTVHLKGDLADIFGTEFLTSDSLHILSNYLDSDNVSMVKDRHYYENIGKYDQFVGGWSDVSTNWYWEEKDVGDSTEIVIKTPRKQSYLDDRYEANQWLSFAKFSISAMMFNHVISGLEAVWANRNVKNEENGDKAKKVDLDLGLLFDPNNTLGIGGLSFRLNF